MNERLKAISDRLDQIYTEVMFIVGYSELLNQKATEAIILHDDWAEFASIMNKKEELKKRSEELRKETDNLRAASIAIAAADFLGEGS